MIAKKVVDTLTDQIADSLADTIDELTKAITATTTGLVENLGVTLDDKIKEIQRIKLEHPFGWSIEVNFGMTDASQKYFQKAKTRVQLADGTTIRTYTDGFRVKHVFVANGIGNCEFCGYVGWLNTGDLDEAIEQSQNFFK